jgi:NAD(P)-dependent dehydrogenase (short-subunit alcohol dehydrogenase family)
MDLHGKTAVISGATGAVGRKLAQELSKRGANLALLDISAEKLQVLTQELALPEKRVLSQVVDLLDASSAHSCGQICMSHFGRLHLLLHVVGGWTGGKIVVETSSEDLRFMLKQHIWTSFNMVQAFVPLLVESGWGRVIMITSPYAAHPQAKGGAYAMGKAGQEALMLTLAQELIGSGVTANLLQCKTIDAKGEKLSHPSQENANWTTPDEIWAAMDYLLEEEAGTVNGAKIPLFGG